MQILYVLHVILVQNIANLIQGWEQRKDGNNVTGTGKEWWYHWKAEELKRTSPSALVPTLIPIDEDGTPNEEKVLNILQFIGIFYCGSKNTHECTNTLPIIYNNCS